MGSEVESFAVRAADRVDESEVGFDPATIIAIITTVLPILMQCFNRADEPDPLEMQAEVRRQNARNPKQLLRRTANAIRRESTERMGRDQATALAEAVIEQILEEQHSTAVACCREVGL